MVSEYAPIGILHSVAFVINKSGLEEEKIIGADFFFLSCLSVLVCVLMVGGRLLGFFLNQFSIGMVILGVIICILGFFSKLSHGILTAKNKIREINFVFLVSNIGMHVVVISMGLMGVLNILHYLLLLFSSRLIQVALSWKKTPWKPQVEINLGILKKQLYFGFFVFLGGLFGSLFYRIDQLMIKEFKGFSELGVYVVAVGLAEKVFLIPDSISAPLIGSLFSSKDESGAKALVEKTVKIVLFSTATFFFLGFFFRLILPEIFGEEFSEMVYVLPWLLFGTIGASVGKVSYPYFLFIGEPKIHTWVTGIALFLNLLCNFLLIPAFGIIGAAIATAISYSVYGGVYLALLIKFEHKARRMVLLSKKDLFWVLGLLKKRNWGK